MGSIVGDSKWSAVRAGGPWFAPVPGCLTAVLLSLLLAAGCSSGKFGANDCQDQYLSDDVGYGFAHCSGDDECTIEGFSCKQSRCLPAEQCRDDDDCRNVGGYRGRCLIANQYEASCIADDDECYCGSFDCSTEVD
jgi:hypothetical protein